MSTPLNFEADHAGFLIGLIYVDLKIRKCMGMMPEVVLNIHVLSVICAMKLTVMVNTVLTLD